jgi:alginate O-acetyltransferase complex protein AlgI
LKDIVFQTRFAEEEVRYLKYYFDLTAREIKMFFNSIEFLIFFPIVVALYFILPQKYRTLHLLIASCIFYMSFIPIYILILGFTIIIDYIAGIFIAKAKGRRRFYFLLMSLFANIGVLAVFKYYNFINENLISLAQILDLQYPVPLLQIILPIGLSFHTFQAMSYTIEVYRGKQKPEYNFITYACYVMFFPQLVAGPIERPQNLIHQFKEKHKLDYKNVRDGLILMLWGFFKKIVIADRLAIVVNTVYGDLGTHTGTSLILATIFFAFQIYCDFSGYSDIAIGAAKVMGFSLMTNFRRPYFAKSINEFWKRWHISLSSWFRDYVYIPLGGNRVKRSRMFFNLMIVFLISGLWHGANWTFVIWGALNGLYLIAGIISSNAREKAVQSTGLTKLPAARVILQILFVFVLACFGWIFFRANTIGDAWYVLTHAFVGLNFNLSEAVIGLAMPQLVIAFASIIFLLVVDYIDEKKGLFTFLEKLPRWIRWALFIIIFMGILLFGVFRGASFIYFQF